MNSNLMRQLIPFLIFYFCFYLPFIFLKKRKEWKLYTLIYLYLLFVYWMTLFPFSIHQFHLRIRPTQLNLHPFLDVYLKTKYASLEILLNILLFFPLGWLIHKRKGAHPWSSLLYCVNISLLIETLQLFFTFHRIADITDILTNSFGALLGISLLMIQKKSR